MAMQLRDILNENELEEIYPSGTLKQNFPIYFGNFFIFMWAGCLLQGGFRDAIFKVAGWDAIVGGFVGATIAMAFGASLLSCYFHLLTKLLKKLTGQVQLTEIITAPEAILRDASWLKKHIILYAGLSQCCDIYTLDGELISSTAYPLGEGITEVRGRVVRLSPGSYKRIFISEKMFQIISIRLSNMSRAAA